MAPRSVDCEEGNGVPAPNPSRGGLDALGGLGGLGGLGFLGRGCLVSSVLRLLGRGFALETNPAARGPSPLGSFELVAPVECNGKPVAEGGPQRQNRVWTNV